MYTEAALQPCTDPYPKQNPELLKGVKGTGRFVRHLESESSKTTKM